MQLPPLDEFPAGPRRVVLEALHVLYRAADGPGVRKISAGLAEGDFRATMNRDLVAKVLSGRQWPTAFQVDSLVRWLADRAIDVKDTDAEAARFLWLYEQADAQADRTVRSPAATRSAIIVASEGKLCGLGVLLTDGTVLTRSYVVADGDGHTLESLRVRPVDADRSTSGEASVRWRAPEDDDGPARFAVLAPKVPIAGAVGAKWEAPPPNGARVRFYGVHRPYSGSPLEGLWLAGTVMGPSGRHGAVQLDCVLPAEGEPSQPTGTIFRIQSAGVLGESGRVVGIVSRHLRNTNCVWMTPSDLIADQVPAATRRRMFG